jgi:hypothetical protein
LVISGGKWFSEVSLYILYLKEGYRPIPHVKEGKEDVKFYKNGHLEGKDGFV